MTSFYNLLENNMKDMLPTFDFLSSYWGFDLSPPLFSYPRIKQKFKSLEIQPGFFLPHCEEYCNSMHGAGEINAYATCEAFGRLKEGETP